MKIIANMADFELTFPHLVADAYSKVVLDDLVGKVVNYKVPADEPARSNFLRAHGTCALTPFRVIGIQRDYQGNLCLRAVSVAYNDTFGRCIAPADVEVVEG